MRVYRRLVINRRVVVNLVSGRAVAGVLIEQRGPVLLIKDATVLEPGADALPVDGDIVIERSAVDFIQAMV